VAAAELLASYGVPILPIQAGLSKAPVPNPADGSWWVVDDPDDVRPVFQQVVAEHGDANLAMVCGREKGSPVLVLDIDGASGLAKLKELNVSSGTACWIQRTGSRAGHLHIAYFQEAGLELHRRVKPQGVDLDLIVNGYAVVPSSITKAPYHWHPGHGPSDIPLAELDPPPAALLNWWHSIQATGPAGTIPMPDGPIVGSARNATLLSLGGTMRRRGMGQAAIRAALMAENIARCQPPLAEAEVRGIASSVARYAPETPRKRGPVEVRFREVGDV
jgi:putative DNA primase/helicase